MESIAALFRELPGLVGFTIQTIIVVLLSMVLRWFWRHVLIRLSHKTATTLDSRVFEATGSGVQTIFIGAGLSFSWKLYGDAIVSQLAVVRWIDSLFVHEVLDHLFFLFLAFAVILTLRRATIASLDWFELDWASRTESTMDEKLAFSFRKIANTVFVVVVVIVVADHFQWPISKLWAAAGIGSLAVAFAAKDTFANMISGITILFDRPFLVGDRIELADGTFGDVVDIGIRSTKVLTFDHTIDIIPNALISDQRVRNHTYPDTKLKVALTIGVAYGSDLVVVKRILNDILTEHPRVLNDPSWGIWFTEFGDSSLNLFIRYWIADYRDKFGTMDEINMEINRRFAATDIEIPFPQRDVHIIATPAVRIPSEISGIADAPSAPDITGPTGGAQN